MTISAQSQYFFNLEENKKMHDDASDDASTSAETMSVADVDRELLDGVADSPSSTPSSPPLVPALPPLVLSNGRFMSKKAACRLSRFMSVVLRHTPESLGLQLGADGFVPIVDLLARPAFKEFDAKHVECVVEFERREGKKQRFTMRAGPRGMEIRANQGHTTPAVSGAQVTRAARDGELPEFVVHGTYLKHMRQIFADGLRPMGRHHVHLFIEEGGIGRKGAEVLVYVEVSKARSMGIEFRISDNGVVLTSCGAEGAIPPDCFSKVIRTKDGVQLHTGDAPQIPAAAYVPPHRRSGTSMTQKPKYRPQLHAGSSGDAPQIPAAAYVPPHRRSGTSTTQKPKYRPPQRRAAEGAPDGSAARSEPQEEAERREMCH